MLLRHTRLLQLGGFFFVPFFYACLLLPVAGAMSLMVGHFSSTALVKFLPF
jgi:hypothetical protein